MVATDEHLGSHCLGADFHQGEETVRRSASNYFQNSAFCKCVKGCDKVLFPAVVPVALSVFQTGEIEAGDLVELPVVCSAFDLAAGEVHQPIEVGGVTLG